MKVPQVILSPRLSQMTHTAHHLGFRLLATPFTASRIDPGCPRLVQEEKVVLASKGHYGESGRGALQLQLSGLGPKQASQGS